MAITSKVKEATVEEIEEAQVKEQVKAQAEIEQAPVYDVHQIIRSISFFNVFGEGGEQPGAVIDAYLSEYLNQGYKLVSTHYLGTSTVLGGSAPQEIAARMLYVLVREG